MGENNTVIILAIFTTIGVLYTFIKLWQFLNAIWKYFIRGEHDFIQRYGKCWVVITGASDGIGKGYAESFAKRGFDICLISKTQHKLDSVANELHNKYNVQTKTIQADFTYATEPGFHESIIDELGDIDIGILVNNVGISYLLFEGADCKRMRDCLVANIFPITLLTRLLVARMYSRQKRSAIINLSSASGPRPYPGASVYSATKSYDRFFSITVGEEYKDKIDFLAVEPDVTTTPMAEPLKGDFWYRIDPIQCSESSLKALGKNDETHGHWKHALHWWMLDLLPEWVFRPICLYASREFQKNLTNNINDEKRQISTSLLDKNE